MKEVWLHEGSAPHADDLMTAEHPVPNPMVACPGDKGAHGQEGAARRGGQAGCGHRAPSLPLLLSLINIL